MIISQNIKFVILIIFIALCTSNILADDTISDFSDSAESISPAVDSSKNSEEIGEVATSSTIKETPFFETEKSQANLKSHVLFNPKKFSLCYNKFNVAFERNNIESLSFLEYSNLIHQLDDYMEQRYESGIIPNPAYSPIFQRLHNGDLNALTKREFTILIQLQKHNHDFQEEIDWNENICADPVLNRLYSIPEKQLSERELYYRNVMTTYCHNIQEDLDEDYNSYLNNYNSQYNKNIPVIYDPPTNPKNFLLPGGLLMIPGLICPIAGGTILANNQYTSDPWEVDVAFNRLAGWIVLAVGIACDCAGLTLVTIGSKKKITYDKFHIEKDKYETMYKQAFEEFSVNVNVDF